MDKKAHLREAYSHFYWKFCIYCKKAFKKEWFWAFNDINFRGNTSHICKRCASTREDAERLIKGV